MISQIFDNPESKYRPVPFWFWNETRPERFNKASICNQIQRLYNQGFGGFVIFNKPAYMGDEKFGFDLDEFLGDRWFESCRIAINEAKRFGMEVWINDDYNFPPGDLGGRMKTLVPDAYARKLEYTTVNSLEGEFAEKNGVLSIIANPKGNHDFSKATLLFAKNKGRTAKFANYLSGYEYLIISEKRIEGTEGHLNRFPCFLDPVVNAVFIQEMYEKYKLHIGDLFGNGLTGFFADCDARRAHSLPWAREFDERFFELKGYPILEYLPTLFYDFGEKSGHVRYDYYDAVSTLYSQWFKSCYQWCKKNGLLYIYHTSDTGPLNITEASNAYCKRSSYFLEGRFSQVNQHGDYIGTDHELMALTGGLHFAMHFNGKPEQWEPIPVKWGTTTRRPDYNRLTLCNKTYGDVRAKYTSSLAHCLCKKGAMSEAFAATNWSATLADLKWIADWQLVQGITKFVPHAVFFSLEGLRKHFAPPDHLHSHLSEHYAVFSTYIGRLCGVLSQGIHVARIAVLDIAESLWFDCNCKSGRVFDLFDILNHSCFDYDVISSEDIINSSITPDGLQIGDETYRILVMVSASNIKDTVFARIERFAVSGGHVVSFDSLPFEHNVHYADIQNYDDSYISADHPIVELLEGIIEPDLICYDRRTRERSGYVHFLHRRTKQEDIYFITNLEGENRSAEFTINVPKTSGVVGVWDPTTGERFCQNARGLKDRNEFDIELPFRNSTLIVIDKNANTLPAPVQLVARYDKRPLLNWDAKALAPNILPLTLWNFCKTQNDRGDKKYEVYAEIELISDITTLFLLVPKCVPLCNVSVNGAFLDESDVSQNEVLFDAIYNKVDMCRYLRTGENRIMLLNKKSQRDRLTYTPLYISGNFHLNIIQQPGASVPHKSWYHFASTIEGTPLIKLGSPEKLELGDWCKQGLPFYSGKVRYSSQFHLSGSEISKRILLECELVNCTGQVFVNSRPAGSVCWAPFRILLSGLRDGINNIELEITNTWANILEEYPLESGLKSASIIIEG